MTSTTAKPDAMTLLTCPSELLIKITRLIDKNTLLSFRQACRKTRDDADDVFLETFFTQRSHLLTTHSLQTLVAITERPSLVKKLKKLTFMITGVRLPSNHGYTQDSNGDSYWLDEEDHEAQCKLVSALRDEIRDKSPALVATCLKNLSNAGVSPIIKLGSYRCSTSVRDGWTDITGLDPRQDEPYDQRSLCKVWPFCQLRDTAPGWETEHHLPGRNWSFGMLLNAIETTGFNLRGFGLSQLGYHPGSLDDQYALQTVSTDRLTSAVRNLEVLELGWVAYLWLPQEWLNMLRLMVGAAAHKLREVALELPHQSQHTMPQIDDWIVQVFSACDIQRFELSGIRYPLRSQYHELLVLDLLRSHKSLETVRLQARDRIPRAILKLIRDDLTVHKIDIVQDSNSEFRTIRPGSGDKIPNLPRSICSLKGIEAVKNGLDGLLENSDVRLWQLGDAEMTHAEYAKVLEKREEEAQKQLANDKAGWARDFLGMVADENLTWAEEFWMMINEKCDDCEEPVKGWRMEKVGVRKVQI